MIRHIVMWQYKDGFSPEENGHHAKTVKAALEALADTIPGIVSLKVIIDPLSSSNRDVVLNSLFESEAALAQYQTHPDHVRASQYVGTVLANRACIDYVA